MIATRFCCGVVAVGLLLCGLSVFTGCTVGDVIDGDDEDPIGLPLPDGESSLVEYPQAGPTTTAPDGTVAAEGRGEEGLVVADLDLGALRRLRRGVPVRRDRRGEVYGRSPARGEPGSSSDRG